MVQAALGARVMLPAPLPEERLDIRHVRAAGDVLDGLVVDAHDRGADERLAVRPGQLDLDDGLLAGLVFLGGGLDFEAEDAAFGRDDHFARLGVNAPVGDGERFDEEVRHVLLDDLDHFLRALAFGVNDLRHLVTAVGRAQEEDDPGIGPRGVDEQVDLVAGRVLAPVGHQFDVVEAEVTGRTAFADDAENVAALDGVLLRVGHLVAEAILSALLGLDLHLGDALCVGREIPPSLDFGLDRLGVLVVGDLEKAQFAGAGDGLVVERLSPEAGVDDVADAVMAAVHPRVNLERLPRNEHAARADDRPPRLVGHFGGDLVLVVRVYVDFPGEGGVNLDLHDAVLADSRLDLGDQFRPLRAAEAPP